MYQNKRVKLIAAEAMNAVIGTSDGKIPWQGLVPSDMKRFVELTTAHEENTVIMGRKTWQSIPAKFRPLSDRNNIIVTRDRNFKAGPEMREHSLLIAPSVEEAICIAPTPAVWIAGYWARSGATRICI